MAINIHVWTFLSIQEIKCPSTQEMMHLEAILHKPINRMQRNSLLLQDMIQCTPPSHPDHKMFQNALKLSQHFLRDQMKVSSTGNDKVKLLNMKFKCSLVCNLDHYSSSYMELNTNLWQPLEGFLSCTFDMKTLIITVGDCLDMPRYVYIPD